MDAQKPIATGSPNAYNVLASTHSQTLLVKTVPIRLFNFLPKTRTPITGDTTMRSTPNGVHDVTLKVRELLKSIENVQLNATSTGEPTYWPADINKKPDLVDFIVTKGISGFQLKYNSNFDLTSYHAPIIVQVNCKATSQLM
ncbi:hypothetical protein EVAR_10038_1 [Eumeta japonica]|uniref:Uncharacterized protein n=1 Tax=Eumeta variegata TaxID=151549 RepID=A0A4C1TR50_EUMVA|nr:hypothetical protein EVAR_10038_1 [Eumeta japonica]